MAKDSKPLIKCELGRSRIITKEREVVIEDRDWGVKITDIRNYKGSSYPYVSEIIIPKDLAIILLDELSRILDLDRETPEVIGGTD